MSKILNFFSNIFKINIDNFKKKYVIKVKTIITTTVLYGTEIIRNIKIKIKTKNSLKILITRLK